jgi:hypothetical protein
MITLAVTGHGCIKTLLSQTTRIVGLGVASLKLARNHHG